jgi:hypothetical protein
MFSLGRIQDSIDRSRKWLAKEVVLSHGMVRLIKDVEHPAAKEMETCAGGPDRLCVNKCAYLSLLESFEQKGCVETSSSPSIDSLHIQRR